jgi:hypothetical protein
MKNHCKITRCCIFALPLLFVAAGPREHRLKDHVVFFCSFDGTTTAEIARGDGAIYTAATRNEIASARRGQHNPDVRIAANQGHVGDALEFRKKSPIYTFYKAAKNVAYDHESWSGAVSFWLQLDPAVDLEPGFCDPIQITDSGYNDAALWIDFTDKNPRDMRLGVIGDLSVWNPTNIPPNKNPEFEKRLVTVKQPPFARGKWTHIVFSFSALNADQGRAQLYVNGELKGSLDTVKDPFTWDESKSNIVLGINYIGLMDELAVFDRALNQDEVAEIYRADGGIKSLLE